MRKAVMKRVQREPVIDVPRNVLTDAQRVTSPVEFDDADRGAEAVALSARQSESAPTRAFQLPTLEQLRSRYSRPLKTVARHCRAPGIQKWPCR
jgi:hypothetical protein